MPTFTKFSELPPAKKKKKKGTLRDHRYEFLLRNHHYRTHLPGQVGACCTWPCRPAEPRIAPHCPAEPHLLAVPARHPAGPKRNSSIPIEAGRALQAGPEQPHTAAERCPPPEPHRQTRPGPAVPSRSASRPAPGPRPKNGGGNRAPLARPAPRPAVLTVQPASRTAPSRPAARLASSSRPRKQPSPPHDPPPRPAAIFLPPPAPGAAHAPHVETLGGGQAAGTAQAQGGMRAPLPRASRRSAACACGAGSRAALTADPRT